MTMTASNISPCIVCDKPAKLRCFYCLRCRAIIGNRVDRLLFRLALRDSYDRDADRFRCGYSHVILDEEDPDSPFYITADHVIPGLKRYIVCARLFNDMKSALTGDEFIRVVPALDDHFLGIRLFERDVIGFIAWNRTAVQGHPRGLASWELPSRAVLGCAVCGRPPFPKSIYCATCRGFIFSRGEVLARVAALKRAWNPKLQAFICYYTGVPLDVSDPKSPWYLVFDHLVPGQKGNIVACAFWVNAMKTFLTEAQFRAVIHALSEHIRRGTPFDKSVLDEKQYRMAVRMVGGTGPFARRL
jgi:hypothetical protein